MKLGFIVLAHEPFEKLRPLLDTLTHHDDVVALHYDLKTPHHEDIKLIRQHYPSVIFAEQVEVEWGEASIVKATLNGMEALRRCESQPDYVTLLSGSCFPISERGNLIKYLEANNGSQFVECVDIRKRQWVKAGLESGRWSFYHYLNWRKTPRLFSLSVKIQRLFGVSRQFPFGNTMYMGSQWWTLSMPMICQILNVVEEHNLFDFAKTTWIPDEFFFQTLVGNLVDSRRDIRAPLMNYRFNWTGIPKVYTRYDFKELADSSRSGKFFTRKVKHTDSALLKRLKGIYQSDSNVVDTEERSDFSEEGNWFKCDTFKHWMGDYPLPVVVFIESKNCSKTLSAFKQQVKADFPEFRVYGELLADELIDYNDEAPLSNYGVDDVALRDYDWQEFLAQIALVSPKGFAFKYGFRKLEGYIDSLKDVDSVAFIELVDHSTMTLEDIRESKKLERYLSKHACQYKRLSVEDVDQFIESVEESLKENLYLKAAAAQGKA
ncbi:beta-1,6-N-acetylglucosaminyltransferase [Ferrimonas marina]|uniref:Peptide O-xylosyltransferase n=1 Tax=Ferrimonas marina TaxID=299255 RepID=A0A1M5VK18_9GAMM|nr:beta-1,6-N-acetylglucosaminyltransferase [Ferrimonas marina]SHH75414.1 Core-2/I-Branching enzyme [Ferrimonas marina]